MSTAVLSVNVAVRSVLLATDSRNHPKKLSVTLSPLPAIMGRNSTSYMWCPRWDSRSPARTQ